MRLIDADALEKEINFSVTITGKDNAAEVKRLMELYNKAIDNAPTIDAVPVVRCKDCTHRYRHDSGMYLCEMYYGMGDVSDENYCSFGERREP